MGIPISWLRCPLGRFAFATPTGFVGQIAGYGWGNARLSFRRAAYFGCSGRVFGAKGAGGNRTRLGFRRFLLTYR